MRGAILATLLAALAVAGCGDEPKAVVKTSEPSAKEKEKPPAPKPKPKAPEKKPDDPPDPPKPLTFPEAWDEAVRLGRALDAEEPERTRIALGALPSKDEPTARSYMQQFGLTEAATTGLTGFGLTAWMEKRSREIAREEPAFKTVMQKIWEPASGARGLLAAMNVWGSIATRSRIEESVALGPGSAKNTRGVREAVLLLGGEKWLASGP